MSDPIYVELTDEQVDLIETAAQAIRIAQQELDTTTRAILAGHHITDGQVLRVTDEHPRRFEVLVAPNGDGA